MISYLYVSREVAKEVGFTHEGTVYGVPTWIAGDTEDTFFATPKIPALWAWWTLAEWFYKFGALLIPPGYELRIPVRVTNRI